MWESEPILSGGYQVRPHWGVIFKLRLERQVKLEGSKKARVSSRRNSMCRSPEDGARKRTNEAGKRWAASSAEKDPGAGRPGKGRYMHAHSWFTWLWSRTYDNTVKQLHSNLKKRKGSRGRKQGEIPCSHPKCNLNVVSVKLPRLPLLQNLPRLLCGSYACALSCVFESLQPHRL